ncbi:helix-turn-helix domain-containing protein [Acerihabitans sp. KWT182]|uniref:Helix-turn-helix domain-containing protein n=1 Tax=Acerihabitans sp. KWT182 TaxID=3157919 RepID=A0AAU7QFZ3_9GAMM
MRLFWLRGYETTSLAELLRAMKVTTPSIYSAFGDKEHLFLEALARYIAGPGGAISPRPWLRKPLGKRWCVFSTRRWRAWPIPSRLPDAC